MSKEKIYTLTNLITDCSTVILNGLSWILSFSFSLIVMSQSTSFPKGLSLIAACLLTVVMQKGIHAVVLGFSSTAILSYNLYRRYKAKKKINEINLDSLMKEIEQYRTTAVRKGDSRP